MIEVGGVYRIDCLATGWSYVGGSHWLPSRWRRHCQLLRRGKHHNARLQEDWARLGAGSFTFHVVEAIWRPADCRQLPADRYPDARAKRISLIAGRERFWTEYYRRERPLYNDAVRSQRIGKITVLLRADVDAWQPRPRGPKKGWKKEPGPEEVR